jgi:hypothetical protein
MSKKAVYGAQGYTSHMEETPEIGQIGPRRMPARLKHLIRSEMERTGITDEWELISAGVNLLAGQSNLTLSESSARLALGIEAVETELRIQSVLQFEIIQTLHELAQISPDHVDAQARSILEAIHARGGAN